MEPSVVYEEIHRDRIDAKPDKCEHKIHHELSVNEVKVMIIERPKFLKGEAYGKCGNEGEACRKQVPHVEYVGEEIEKAEVNYCSCSPRNEELQDAGITMIEKNGN
jgi:hypothetical protein